MRRPVDPPLLAQMLETARLRAITPTTVSLGAPEKHLPGTPQAAGVDFDKVQAACAAMADNANRAAQAHVDHIQRRDRNYTDAMDPFRGTAYGSAP
ncbi:hypothetical protein D9M73_103400 [compost metagenome]